MGNRTPTFNAVCETVQKLTNNGKPIIGAPTMSHMPQHTLGLLNVFSTHFGAQAPVMESLATPEKRGLLARFTSAVTHSRT